MRSSLLAVTVLTMLCGCHRRREERPAPVPRALRFYAWTRLAGPMHDTIALEVSVKNVGRLPVALAFSMSCGVGARLEAIPLTANRSHKWSMTAWLRADGPAPSSPLALQQVCAGSLLMVSPPLAPGATGFAGSLRIPVIAILGDSLPPGKYHFRASPDLHGAHDVIVDAGNLDVPLPRRVQWRTKLSVSPPSGSIRTITAIVVDSITGDPIPRATIAIGRGAWSPRTTAFSTATTDANGKFELAMPSSGADSLHVFAFEYMPFAIAIDPEGRYDYRGSVAMKRAPVRERWFVGAKKSDQ